MDTIEQLIAVAKTIATTDEQKKRVQFASIVYDMTKMQELQNHITQLQCTLLYGCVSGAQREYITHAINDAMLELSRLNATLNNECLEQVADFLIHKRV